MPAFSRAVPATCKTNVYDADGSLLCNVQEWLELNLSILGDDPDIFDMRVLEEALLECKTANPLRMSLMGVPYPYPPNSEWDAVGSSTNRQLPCH